MFLNAQSAVSALALLGSECSPARGSTDAYHTTWGDRTPDDDEPSPALQEQLDYAVACMRSAGCPIDLGEHASSSSSAAVSSRDNAVLGRVLTGLAEALRRNASEREKQHDVTCRLQSDLRVLQSVRQRLEEEKEAGARELGHMRTKLLASEEQFRRQLKESDGHKDQLQRQLKELKQRQAQQEHVLKRRDGELEAAQRHLQDSLRRATNGHAAPAAGGPANGAAAAAGGRREGVQHVGCGANSQGLGRSAARRVTGPPPYVHGAGAYAPEALAQRVSDLEHELEAAHASQDAAVKQLHSVTLRAEELGFAAALRLDTHRSMDSGRGRARNGSRELPRRGSGDAVHASLADWGAAERVTVGGAADGSWGQGNGGQEGDELSPDHLAALRERCRRWQAEREFSGGWQGCGDAEQLRRQLRTAGELLLQQGQALDASAVALRQQQDHAAALEARIMALEARLEAALIPGSRPDLEGHAHATFHSTVSPPAAGEVRRRSVSAPGAAAVLPEASPARGGGVLGGRGGGGGGGGTPTGRKVWSRSSVLASPKVQLRSSFAVMEPANAVADAADEAAAAPTPDPDHGSVRVQVRPPDGFHKQYVGFTANRETASAAAAGNPSSSSFVGLGGGRQQQRRVGRGLGHAERMRPTALDLGAHMQAAEGSAGFGDSSEAGTPVLVVPQAGASGSMW